MASVCVAYFLWLIGGFFGFHHLYLGRVCHAFTWFCTGGGFGLGLLWDLCEIPFYTDECNNIKEYLLDVNSKRRSIRCSTIRFLGQLILGCLNGFVLLLAVPMHYLELTHYQNPIVSILISLFVALGVAAGVYVVGNIGLQQRSFLQAWLGAWPAIYILVGLLHNYNGIVFGALSSAILSNRAAKWRSRRPPFGTQHYVLWCCVFVAVWCWGLGYNVTVDVNGKSVRLGSLFISMIETVNEKEGFFRYEWTTEEEERYDWQDTWRVFMENLKKRKVATPRQISKAYKLLKLSSDASPEVIRNRCHELIKSSHPDRSGSDSADDFVAYRAACELLDWRGRHKHDEF